MALLQLPANVTLAAGVDSVVLAPLPAALPKRRIEPVGRAFQGYFHRKRHNRTITEQEIIDKSREQLTEGDDDDTFDEPETADLLRLDPKYWKEQDHYAVLGLSRLRFRATEEDLKKAFRKKVLKHHPDKKAAQHNGRTDDDSFFKCIQKAYDLLMNPETRRHFDSVDPTFDDGIPSTKKALSEQEFYKAYGPVFERNARFSKIQPVPLLGDETATLQEVEAVYDFWYNFDSWRVFNYLDEEEGSGGDDKNRDDKRYLDKKNRKQREEKKTEDNRRIRRFVDQALEIDPRIKRLKAEEKARKQREKEAKMKGKSADTNKETEEQARIEAERLAAEKAQKDEEERRQKVDKDSKKKAVQKERKTFRRILKQRNFFMLPETVPDSAEMLTAIGHSESIVSDLSIEDLTALNASMTAEPRAAWSHYMKVVSKMFGESAVTPEPPYVEPVETNEGVDEEPAATAAKPSKPAEVKKPVTPTPIVQAETAKKQPTAPIATHQKASSAEPKKSDSKREENKPSEKAKATAESEQPKETKPATPAVEWSDREVALLIEGVKKFPGGTVNRWKKIMDHINQHNPGAPVPKKEKDVIGKSKSIENTTGLVVPTETHIKVEKKHSDTVIKDKPTERFEVDDSAASSSGTAKPKAKKQAAPAPAPVPKKPTVEELILQDETWTKEQVQQLQEAMRKCPGDMDNRWDRIAELVNGKSKKDCQSKAKKIQQILKEMRKAEGGQDDGDS